MHMQMIPGHGRDDNSHHDSMDVHTVCKGSKDSLQAQSPTCR